MFCIDILNCISEYCPSSITSALLRTCRDYWTFRDQIFFSEPANISNFKKGMENLKRAKIVKQKGDAKKIKTLVVIEDYRQFQRRPQGTHTHAFLFCV